MDVITDLQPWHWFVLALALFTLEVFASTGFFIGIATAALLLSVLLFLMPAIAWEWQLALFGLGSVLLTLGYFKYFRGINQATDSPLLNNRAAQLVGTRFVLDSDFKQKGAVMIHDTRWQACSEEVLAAGDTVEVVGCEGMTLRLQRLPN